MHMSRMIWDCRDGVVMGFKIESGLWLHPDFIPDGIYIFPGHKIMALDIIL